MEKFLPNASEARLFDPENADSYEHGITAYEFSSTSLNERARAQMAYLDSEPLTAYIVTSCPHEYLLELQHWFGKGYWVGDASDKLLTSERQVTHLYRAMF